MSTPVSPRSRFSHLPRVISRALAVFLPFMLLVAFLALHHRKPAVPAAATDQTSFNTPAAEWSTAPEAPPAQTASRPVFPYSIVPGGVRDSHELQSAASSDPVVLQHYSDFRITRARAIQLDRPLAMYVSYRRDNRVFWTRKPMTIPAGETLLTDGEHFARTRCANRLSPTAVKPVAASEPTTEQLEEPVFVPPLLANLLPGEGFNTIPGSPAIPPSIPNGVSSPPPGSGTPPVLPPILFPGGPPITPNIPVPPPPVSTPEPATLQLLAVSVLVALLILVFHRK